MAQVRIEGDDVVVSLSPLEKLGALMGDVRVPLAGVRGVRRVERAWPVLRGWRVGTGLPFVIVLGRMFHRDGCDFVAVYGTGPALVAELAPGERFARLVVSGVDEGTVAAIRARIP